MLATASANIAFNCDLVNSSHWKSSRSSGGLRAPALRLARDAVREEPKNSYAWATLSVLLRPGDPAASERALQRARKLNPRLGRRRVKPQRQPSALREQHDSGGVGGP